LTKYVRKKSFRGPNHKPNGGAPASPIKAGKIVFCALLPAPLKRLLGAQLRSDYFLRQLQNDKKPQKTLTRQKSEKREMKTKNQSDETQSFTNADIECGNKYDFIMKNVSTG